MTSTRGKGIFAALAISAAMLVPAAVATAGNSYSSAADSSAATLERAGQPFDLGFTSLIRDGRVVAVKNFRFSGVNANCKVGGPIEVRGRVPRMKVHSRKFESTVRKNGARIRVNGKFRNHGSRAKGRIRVNGSFNDGNKKGCSGGHLFAASQN